MGGGIIVPYGELVTAITVPRRVQYLFYRIREGKGACQVIGNIGGGRGERRDEARGRGQREGNSPS